MHPRDANTYANALPEIEFHGIQPASAENRLIRATRLSVIADYWCERRFQLCGNPNSLNREGHSITLVTTLNLMSACLDYTNQAGCCDCID